MAETPLLLYRGHKQGEGATEGTQASNLALLSPDTLPPGLAPTRVLLASLDLEFGCKPACLPSWSLLCRGQEWTERERKTKGSRYPACLSEYCLCHRKPSSLHSDTWSHQGSSSWGVGG